MNYIIKYQNFNESKGISDSSEKITNSIWDDIESDIINSKAISKKLSFIEDDFKIKDIQIKIDITKGEENLCNALSDLKVSKIEDGTLVGAKMSFDIRYKEMDDPFLYYIKSILFHEILHLFQNYNLKLNGKFRPESFSIGSIIPQLRQGIKTKYIEYILDILYYSLSHEISAQLHQYYMYKKSNKEYKKIEEIKNLLSNFKVKKLNKDEENELEYVKNHILGSIRYFTDNKKYKKDILGSIWSKNNDDFLIDLYDLIDKKLKWIDKKVKLINSKLGINYNETFTYYGKLEDFKYIDSYNFISNNLNDCPTINNV